MGDMKNPGRGVPLAHADDLDPFAELADMFEAELAMDTQHGRVPSVRPASDDRQAPSAQRARVDAAGRHAPLAPHDQDFDAAFDAALGDEFVAPPEAAAAPGRAPHHGVTPVKPEAAEAYQSWIVQRGARPAVTPPARPVAAGAATVSQGRSSYAGRSLGADLETAIHGLSAPANPRDVIVVETQSFAPERVVDDYRHAPAQPELDEFDELIASELAVMNEPIQGSGQAYPAFYGQSSAASYESGDPSGAFEDTYYAEEAPAAPARRSSKRRTAVTLGGGALSLALIGAVGLFVWNGNATNSSLQASNEPLLIKADNEPFKTVPKDPGGRTVPNQNKAVYNRVNGSDAQPSTTQQALLTDAEEPMDLPVEEEPAAYADLPGVDPIGEQSAESDPSQERLETASADAVPAAASEESPVPVLQPRKVRTMSVRPDGTIVAAEAEAPAVEAPAAAAPAAPAPVRPAAAATPSPAPVRQAVAAPAPQPVAEPAVAPSSQAADPIEVAAIAPQAAPAAPMPTGGYFVQISSQPSEAAAQQSMRSLGSKFSGVISGRPVGIQAAEIPGKGTFYRVRVAAASKDEASEICGRLKAAGGNCFVAR